MSFMNADDMKKSISDSGEVAVQGLYFDTDKDSIKAVSQPVVAEIAKLLKSAPSLRLHVVGHTDNQGKARIQPRPESPARKQRRRGTDQQVRNQPQTGWMHLAVESTPRSRPTKRRAAGPGIVASN